jgi:hypothetical protein
VAKRVTVRNKKNKADIHFPPHLHETKHANSKPVIEFVLVTVLVQNHLAVGVALVVFVSVEDVGGHCPQL